MSRQDHEFLANLGVIISICKGSSHNNTVVKLNKHRQDTAFAIRFLRGLRWVRVKHHEEWDSVYLTTTRKGRVGMPYLRRHLLREVSKLSDGAFLSLFPD